MSLPEDTVYLLNPDGASWKFMQTSAAGLTCEPIANFSHTGVNRQLFFAFPAGSIHEQTLHLGIFDGEKLTLQQYKENNWESVAGYDFANFSRSRSFTVLGGTGSVACCFTCTENRFDGLIVLKPNQARSALPACVLYYNADKQTLERSNEWQYSNPGLPHTAIEIAPDTILVDGRGAIFSWTKEGNDHKMVQGRTPRFFERSNLFLLYAKKLAKYAFWACFVREADATKLQFYTVTHAYPYTLQRSSDLPEEVKQDNEPGIDHSIDHSESLILPFSEAVYVVTRNKNRQLIYYRGSLQESSGS